ncbi:MAG: dihydropteroate synthase [Akkermansiaceae bacterium]|nr:dihydropteroate synthase [Akkermansiaceae bacterium]NNM31271.1 dihydropteroate synthase [Akkermansiaceae bacterium]
MGIVNVNDDSFSGDGTPDVDMALQHAAAQVEAGADVIDVGAESARTNRRAIPAAEEAERFAEFLELWPAVAKRLRPADDRQVWPPVLSANTWRPAVARAVLERGVELLNDMGGLPNARNARLCARHGAALLIMHSVGEPKVDHRAAQWDDIMAELQQWFRRKMALAVSAGLNEDQLLLDPGIDFAKQRADNLRIYRELESLHACGRPILLPVSRKTVIGEVLGIEDPSARDAGTVACLAAGLVRGAQLFRVHKVAAAYRAVRVLTAVERARV